MNRSFWRLFLLVAALATVVYGVSTFQAAERGDELRLWFLDVGQGDAILIDTPDARQVLIDGGPNASVLQGLSRALPLTDKELDLVIVTHDHADHLAGINEVLRHYKVNEVWVAGTIYDSQTYKTFISILSEKNIPVKNITAGKSITFGLLTGIAIFPLENMVGQQPTNPHDADIVTYWQYGAETFLLTGDAESEHEQAMLSRGIVKHADILKVGHHGSTTSTSEAFLKAVSPKVAVISAGEKNRYGHPAFSTLERLRSLNIPVLRTDQDGAIEFKIWPDHYTYKVAN